MLDLEAEARADVVLREGAERVAGVRARPVDGSVDRARSPGLDGRAEAALPERVAGAAVREPDPARLLGARNTLTRLFDRPCTTSEGRTLVAVGVARLRAADRFAEARLTGATARRAVASRCTERAGVLRTSLRAVAFALGAEVTARLVAVRVAEPDLADSL